MVLAAASATAAGRPGGARAARRRARRAARAASGTTSSAWSSSSGTSPSRPSTATAASTRTCTPSRRCSSAADVLGRRGAAGAGAADRHPGRARPRRAATSGGSPSTSTRPGPRCWSTTSTSRPTRSGRTARRSGTGWSGRGWRCTCAPALGDAAPDWLLDDARSLFDAVRARGLGRRRRGRVRLHGRLGRCARRTRADALGRGGGDRDRGGPARRDGRAGVRRLVRHLVAARRRLLPRPRARVVAARAVARRTSRAA